MINFIDGKFNIDEKNILVASNEELNALHAKGLIEKRKDNVGTYYYVETEVSGMKFGVIISLREKKIQWLRLHWLDSPMKGWNDVSVKGVKQEYHLLLKFIENAVERQPDLKKNREQTWHFKWGQIDVSFDLRSFQADIFIIPR